MPKNTPDKFTIKKVKRTRNRIFIAFHNGTDDKTVNSTENALPAFQKALDALAPLVATILHLPPDYTGTPESNLRVCGVVMGSQGGGETVSILAQKSLSDASKAFNIVTPPRLLEHPSEEGSYTAELANVDAELVFDLIEASKDYALGERAQGTLEFIGGGDDDDGDVDDSDAPEDNTETLPFSATQPGSETDTNPESKGSPAKKRGAKKTKGKK